MLSAKNEKHAVGATLLFNVMHYALRPWPWILVALTSLVIFPDLQAIADRFPQLPAHVVRNDLAYPAMLTYLPSGLLGLVVTSLAAAYMSTMSTQVNWGSSIIVNDVYHRFINRTASEKQLVWAGRLATVVLMVVACVLALFLENALQVFEIILLIGAGTGLLFLLRWFWWRINAATEIVAMVVSFCIAIYFQLAARNGWPGGALEGWEQLLLSVVLTTAAWVAVAFTTRPTDRDVLLSFYQHVQPGGPGWRRVVEDAERRGLAVASTTRTDLPYALACAVFGAMGIYSVLFATGLFLYSRVGLGLVFAGLAAACLTAIVLLWPRLTFGDPLPEGASTRP
jgi:SSS family solute:Na+ symporter